MSTTRTASRSSDAASRPHRCAAVPWLRRAIELLLRGQQQMLVERVSMDRYLHPLAAADDRQNGHLGVGDPHVCSSCTMCFSGAASSENDHSSMNFVSNTAPVDNAVQRRRHPLLLTG